MMKVSTDILSDALGLMRITGSLLLIEMLLPPWGAVIPDQTVLKRLLQIERNTQVGVFHLAQQGSFHLDSANSEQIVIGTGDVVICFGGLKHTISQGELPVLVALEEYLKRAVHPFHPPGANEQRCTVLICGFFLMRDTYLNPLFASLPAFLHIKQPEILASGLSLNITDLLAREIAHSDYGSDYTVQRLLELLCVDAIRVYMNTATCISPDWFCGIKDPQLGKALYQFHQAPGEAWSVSKLAAVANLSPSRFAARFSDTLGESCMVYVTKWRLNVARNLLQMTDNSIDEIAHLVGYQNLSAFTRVFKRYMGISPSSWRASCPLAGPPG